jgi:hypothetical protein
MQRPSQANTWSSVRVLLIITCKQTKGHTDVVTGLGKPTSTVTT